MPKRSSANLEGKGGGERYRIGEKIQTRAVLEVMDIGTLGIDTSAGTGFIII